LLLGIRAPRVLERVTRTSCFDNQGGTDVAEISCGIDWAQDHHDIAIVDADGRLVAKRPIPESVAGCAELTAMLADAGDDPKDPIPVAIETPRGLLVAALRATGRPIYPIHPMSVACYRERSSMSGNKSDHADAVTLANILRTDADQHRRLPADSELAQSITVLARAHQDATWRRTRAGNELQSLLLFLHYGFDLWISREYPGVRFERFADDAVIHCVTERQAWEVRRRQSGVGSPISD
jgi:Transposase